MTQEDKKLLIKDLCTRLPYGVKVKYKSEESGNVEIGEIEGIDSNEIHEIYGFYLPDRYIYSVDEFIPYLRPMSTMTKKEKMEVTKLGVCDDGAFHNDIYDIGISMEEAFTAISWFLERHFDINYLIQKGLALEAPEGMYKF